MTAIVMQGDAANLPFPDNSIDLIVTSPPYYALRSYTDGGLQYDGQIGAEPTPRKYIDNLIACTAEWTRVLKPAGSIFVNLGDKYGGSTTGAQDSRSKSLLGLPWRYAIRCIDDLGLILRAEILWSKRSGLPVSVKDRVRRSHEQIFHLTKSPHYYTAIDHIRQPHQDTSALGALPGSVWELASEPLRVPDYLPQHFAAFPTALPIRIIQGWSPSGICTACGEGRRPVAGHTAEWRAFREAHGMGDWHRGDERAALGVNRGHAHGVSGSKIGAFGPKVEIKGEACDCPDTASPTTPALVLDPFGGTGTTALVASVLGRTGISVDLSLDYCRLAAWRTTDEKQRQKVRSKAFTPVPAAK